MNVEELFESSDEDEISQAFLVHAKAFNLINHHYFRNESKHGGSRPGRKPNIDRRHLDGARLLHFDYFADPPLYNENMFRRRFRMRRSLFLRIVHAVKNENEYFVQRRDAVQKLGLSSVQKITDALRQLAYGIPGDACDEYLRLAESTALKCLKQFCSTINKVFESEYLRYPNENDLQILLKVAEQRGFPGMLGSLDCMHWGWKNCPAAWAGQYQGKESEPTIILEAVASYDLWIWHAFFGMPGAHNDVNVLDRSPLFSELCQGQAPEVQFQVNNKVYEMGYYFADGIYPDYATLIKTISSPQGEKKKYFAKMQEAFRKDVERAFGVLQARFAIISTPSRLWKQEDLASIMKTCVILHNMIIDDERELKNMDQFCLNNFTINRSRPTADFNSFLNRFNTIRDFALHYQLRNDLIEHIWSARA